MLHYLLNIYIYIYTYIYIYIYNHHRNFDAHIKVYKSLISHTHVPTPVRNQTSTSDSKKKSGRLPTKVRAIAETSIETTPVPFGCKPSRPPAQFYMKSSGVTGNVSYKAQYKYYGAAVAQAV
jgi:hypothetical protein